MVIQKGNQHLLLTPENLLNLYLIKNLGVGRDGLNDLSAIYPEQKYALFLLDSHVQTIMGGWDQILQLEAMRNHYLAKVNADPLEFLDAHLRTTPNLEDDERLSLANQKKEETLSSIRKFLEEHGESLASLDEEAKRIQDLKNNGD